MEELLKNTKQKDEIKKALAIMMKAQNEGVVETVPFQINSKFIQQIIELSSKYDADISQDEILLGHVSKLESMGAITEELYPAVAEILATIFKMSNSNRVN